jgi:hypothetical protein
MTTASPKTRVRPLAELRGDGTTVAVREVETPKGERLELESVATGETIRLDAVALETLTWQERDAFENFVAEGLDGSDPGAVVATTEVPGEASTTRLVEITNEFGHVVVREVTGATEPLLELAAPKMGFAVVVNAVALGGVVGQPPETFTELLRRRVE